MKNLINSIETLYRTSSNIYNNIFELIQASPIFAFTIRVSKGTKIIRARYADNKQPFSSLKDVSYPSPDKVTCYGRLNRPNESVFYGGETPDACLSEMLPMWFNEYERGNKLVVTIGVWNLLNDIDVVVIPSSYIQNHPLNSKILISLNEEERKLWDYLSLKFRTSTKDDSQIYELTASITNSILVKAQSYVSDIAGVIYPSVQSQKHLNLALSTKLVDSNILQPSYFTALDVEHLGYDNKNLPVYKGIYRTEKGILAKNRETIIWSKPQI